MATTLNKKVGDLESTYWANAEAMMLPGVRAAMEYIEGFEPLDNLLAVRWEDDDREAVRIMRRLSQIENSMLPVHPDFLPDYDEIHRRSHWAAHHSADYRELLEKYFARFLDFAQTHYDLADGGLIGVAMKLHEADIARWTRERDYIGVPQMSPEEMARDMIATYKIFKRKLDESGNPADQGERDALWQQAMMESEFHLYGRQVTIADRELDKGKWAQITSDMAAGVLSSESEAVAYFRDQFARYPHR
jgi:hypothetical protein